MTSTAIATIPNYDAIDAATGNEVDDAPRLQFRDGGFSGGFDKLPVDLGTVFRVHPMSVQDGFTPWRDGKPGTQVMREWCRPEQHPIDRNQLGDLDEARWPDGKDPWAYTMIVAFKDGEGTLYKFTTSSAGGSNAIRKMLRLWRRDRDRHPGLVPVVALGTDSYEHKTHRTRIKVPTFEIVGWEAWDEDAPAALPKPDPAGKFADVLNDDIPF